MINNMHLAKVAGIIQPVEKAPRTHEAATVQNASVSFREILDNKMETPVHFSKHAALRLSDRNISLSNEQLSRLTEGIGKANEKGIRDSLVLIDNIALVVNVKSRTVITAISQMQENVFSNIDGAVIA
jgi:flagellar operon protein